MEIDLLDMQKRKEVVARIDRVVSYFYQDIVRETPLEEAGQIVLAHASELSDLTNMMVDDPTAQLIGYQAREMIRNNGIIKRRKSGVLYATHPLCVAAIAADLSRSADFPVDVAAEAIQLSLLHDVIEEGERVPGYRRIVADMRCPEKLAMEVELLDMPLVEGLSYIDQDYKATVAFAHSLRRARNDAVRMAELGDRFDGVMELDYILRKPVAERREKLISALAKWDFVVGYICGMYSNTFGAFDDRYDLLRTLATDVPLVLELGDQVSIFNDIEAIKDAMGVFYYKQEDFFDRVVETYYAGRGVDMRMVYHEREVRMAEGDGD